MVYFRVWVIYLVFIIFLFFFMDTAMTCKTFQIFESSFANSAISIRHLSSWLICILLSLFVGIINYVYRLKRLILFWARVRRILHNLQYFISRSRSNRSLSHRSLSHRGLYHRNVGYRFNIFVIYYKNWLDIFMYYHYNF